MRRIGLFAAFLLLLGLTTATAASFDVQAEDITSFSEPVNIEVPTPLALGPKLYVRGESGVLPGHLDLEPPANNDNTEKKRLFTLSPTPLFEQDSTDSFFTWQTPDAPPSGYSLTGTVKLFITMFDADGHKLTAGLIKCPKAAPPSSLHDDDCQLIGRAISTAGSSAGRSDVIADFGTVPATIIPKDWQLRLKVVNRSTDDSGVTVSSDDWELQWGYLQARQSRLEITP